MFYKCNNCRRVFEFDDQIEFCPYCGRTLDGEPSFSGKTETADLSHMIDSIWGDDARIKREFSDIISECICYVNDYAERSVEKAFPEQTLSDYEKNYSQIRQSSSRKTLLARIEKYIGTVGNVIDNLSDGLPEETADRIRKAVQETYDMMKELYDFLGFRYTPSREELFSDGNFSAEVLFTKEQLKTLYDMVLAAYAKYRKCVEDNNMFAAFASTSDYGTMTGSWRVWRPATSSDHNEESNRSKYDKVIGYMKMHNAEKYCGMLDEDFVPHVDAFWYGLEKLCCFTDHHISVKCNTNSLFINDNERSRLLRNVISKNYVVNETRLAGAIQVKERFGERIDSLNDSET